VEQIAINKHHQQFKMIIQTFYNQFFILSFSKSPNDANNKEQEEKVNNKQK